MSGASVTISPDTRQPGDSLFLNQPGILDGTGITPTGEGTNELTFAGLAPSANYERVLEAVQLDVGLIDSQRELVLHFQRVRRHQPEAVAEQPRRGDGHAGARCLKRRPLPMRWSAPRRRPDHAALMATLVDAHPIAA